MKRLSIEKMTQVQGGGSPLSCFAAGMAYPYSLILGVWGLPIQAELGRCLMSKK